MSADTDEYTVYLPWNDRMALQNAYNRHVSMLVEMIAKMPIPPPMPIVRQIPWWRVGLRLRHWMLVWDYRFSMRYRK